MIKEGKGIRKKREGGNGGKYGSPVTSINDASEIFLSSSKL